MAKDWTSVTKRLPRDTDGNFTYVDRVAPDDAPADYRPPQPPVEMIDGTPHQAPQQEGFGSGGS